MNKELELEHFSGPLDLLLQLIEQEELQITDIALADVTEQFIKYLEEVEERHPHELADFLTIATRLLLLKSQALMPYLHPDEEEDPGDLEAQLKMYKRYVEAMRGLEEMLADGKTLHPRTVHKSQEVIFRPPEEVGVDVLKEYFVDVLKRLEPVVRIPKAAVQRVVTLREKFAQIHDLLKGKAELGFTELISENADKAEVVVTFLALLELVKQQSIYVKQEKPLADIVIERAD